MKEIFQVFNRNNTKGRRGIYEKEVFHTNHFFNYFWFRTWVCGNDVQTLRSSRM